MMSVIDFFSGLIATWIMDFTAKSLVRRGLIHLHGFQIVPALLGRWILNSKSQVIYEDIRRTPSKTSENPVGMFFHYWIGGALGVIYGLAVQVFPSLEALSMIGWGLIYGGLTNALPWLMMYPSMGFGFFARKLAIQKELLKFSLINHLVFGLGLGILTTVFGMIM
jgi:hypothetical protein